VVVAAQRHGGHGVEFGSVGGAGDGPKGSMTAPTTTQTQKVRRLPVPGTGEKGPGSGPAGIRRYYTGPNGSEPPEARNPSGRLRCVWRFIGLETKRPPLESWSR